MRTLSTSVYLPRATARYNRDPNEKGGHLASSYFVIIRTSTNVTADYSVAVSFAPRRSVHEQVVDWGLALVIALRD